VLPACRQTLETIVPSSYNLDGLMKFLSRDQWQECFAEVFDQHFSPVLVAEERGFDELEEILGARLVDRKVLSR
jgi:hypothetical protein